MPSIKEKKMKRYTNVHGSHPRKPPEIDTQSSPTTVYIRENIQKEIIDGVSFWVYDETQYTTREYIQLQANELKRTNLAAADLYQSLSATMMDKLPESAGYLASVYPVWQPDTEYKQWQLITHKGIAYQVQQDTTSQEIYPPDGTGLLAIYVPYVVPGADGVKPWAYGAHYYTGDLVRKDGVVREAKKDMLPCVWEPTEGNEWTKRDDLA